MSAVRWIELLVVAVFTYQVTGSAFIVTMMALLRLLPMALFGAFMGAWADRLDRRLALLGVLTAMLLSSATIAALAWTGRLEVWHLAVSCFINGTAWATDNALRRILIGDVVGADTMATAMALDIGANNASRMIGPAVGGVLMATAGRRVRIHAERRSLSDRHRRHARHRLSRTGRARGVRINARAASPRACARSGADGT